MQNDTQKPRTLYAAILIHFLLGLPVGAGRIYLGQPGWWPAPLFFFVILSSVLMHLAGIAGADLLGLSALAAAAFLWVHDFRLLKIWHFDLCKRMGWRPQVSDMPIARAPKIKGYKD